MVQRLHLIMRQRRHWSGSCCFIALALSCFIFTHRRRPTSVPAKTTKSSVTCEKSCSSALHRLERSVPHLTMKLLLPLALTGTMLSQLGSQLLQIGHLIRGTQQVEREALGLSLLRVLLLLRLQQQRQLLVDGEGGHGCAPGYGCCGLAAQVWLAGDAGGAQAWHVTLQSGVLK